MKEKGYTLAKTRNEAQSFKCILHIHKTIDPSEEFSSLFNAYRFFFSIQLSMQNICMALKETTLITRSDPSDTSAMMATKNTDGNEIMNSGKKNRPSFF